MMHIWVYVMHVCTMLPAVLLLEVGEFASVLFGPHPC